MSIEIYIVGNDIDEKVIELNENDMKLLQYHVNKDFIINELKERIKNDIQILLDDAYNNLRKEWHDKLGSRWNNIPYKREDFMQLCYAQPDYFDKHMKDNPHLYPDIPGNIDNESIVSSTLEFLLEKSKLEPYDSNITLHDGI